MLSLLESHLSEEDAGLPASIFHERIARDLDELRGQGSELPQTAQAYVANWLAEGYLERRFPAGKAEEVYELSTSTAEAIRFVSAMVQPHSAATESRLTLVIQAVVRLAEETDSDTKRRTATLMAERQRIDRQIEAIQSGQIHVIPDHSALERAREIISGTRRDAKDGMVHSPPHSSGDADGHLR